MYGKTLGVVEYNLTFGTNKRMVNVFGCFKYKKNNNLYIVYADVDTKYEFIHYGCSHIRQSVVLSMSPREDDAEIIKEYIYKVINNEDLSLFERIDLTEATGIEIISSSNLEVKLDVIRKLEELMIPSKKEELEEVKPEVKVEEKKPKKKSNKIWILVILIALIGVGGGYFYLINSLSSTVSKKIVCNKEFSDTKLNAIINETNTYVFYNSDRLDNVETVMVYKFNDESVYQDFFYRGSYYKYIPTKDAVHSFDDTLRTFEVKSVKKVDSAYDKPTNYEEVISYYSNDGYVCQELIEEK